jgi:hypothetical protein
MRLGTTHVLKRGRVALAVIAVGAALAVPAAGVAAANPAVSSSISSSADWISPTQIVVYVTVSCAPWFSGGTTPGAGTVYVNVNQATSASSPGGFGFMSTSFTCDNQNHRLALNVSPGPWQLGTAFAIVQACGFSCDTPQTKQIRITKA